MTFCWPRESNVSAQMWLVHLSGFQNGSKADMQRSCSHTWRHLRDQVPRHFSPAQHHCYESGLRFSCAHRLLFKTSSKILRSNTLGVAVVQFAASRTLNLLAGAAPLRVSQGQGYRDDHARQNAHICAGCSWSRCDASISMVCIGSSKR